MNIPLKSFKYIRRYKNLKGVKMMVKYLGLHETLEVHELLTFKNLCLTKSTTMGPLAQDEELKTILSNDVSAGQQQIQQLQQVLTNREANQ
jgi:similar to spore coat protein